MLGAIVGDYLGSCYEFSNVKEENVKFFSRNHFYTDDTFLTVATADAILHKKDFAKTYREYFRLFPDGGYGRHFSTWACSDEPVPYNSYGNGSAMRVSPVAWAHKTLEEVRHHATRSASVTHNHPEGIKGAVAVAVAIWMARNGLSKKSIQVQIVQEFGYDLDFDLCDIRDDYQFDVTCQGSVPQAIKAYLESTSFESAIRLAISIGGDSDTIAAIAGSIAEAEYGIHPDWLHEVERTLPKELKEVVAKFALRFM